MKKGCSVCGRTQPQHGLEIGGLPHAKERPYLVCVDRDTCTALWRDNHEEVHDGKLRGTTLH